MKTTLKKIKQHSPCLDGWIKLLNYLNKTKADDEELSLLTILESNGLDDAIWVLRAVEGFEKEKRLMACDFAESVVHLANDERCVNAIKVSRNYANGLATIEELNSARDGASAAGAVHIAAVTSAMAAADSDSYDAAMYAAYWADKAVQIAAAGVGTARAVCFEQERQIEIFKKYVK